MFRSEGESFKHVMAKMLLAIWLKERFLRVDTESRFCMAGQVMFVPDLACYDQEGICEIWEVCHKNSLSAKKLVKIQHYKFVHDLNFKIYEVDAEYILNQVEPPEQIRKIEYT